VDATYRSDLRETNELNYARFEAKLEQRLAELRAELKADIASVRADLVGMETRLDARLDSRLAAAMRDQTRFLFVAWAALLAPIIGLWFR
jgi:hypothetical protein